MDILPSIINKLEKSYMNTYKLGVSNGNPETFKDPAKKQKFKENFLTLCLLEQTKNDEINLIRNFECSSIDAFDREFKVERSKLTQNAHQDERYLRFATEIDKIVVLSENEAQDMNNMTRLGDDMEVEETQCLTDPISKTLIRDPVRNKLCGHIYERKTILEAIALNERVKCPYMGCGNKRPVKRDSIQDDYELKAKLDRLYTQQERREDEMEEE